MRLVVRWRTTPHAPLRNAIFLHIFQTKRIHFTNAIRLRHRPATAPQGSTKVSGAPTPTRDPRATAARAAGAAVFLCAVDPHPHPRRVMGTKMLRARSASRHKNKSQYFVEFSSLRNQNLDPPNLVVPLSGLSSRSMSSRWTPEALSGSGFSNADRQTAVEGHETKPSALAGRWSRLAGQDGGRESAHVRRSCSCVRVSTVGASDALSVGRSVALSLSTPYLDEAPHL